MRFTLRQLAYFVAAAQSGSVRLGAERANISQPAISAAITQLEAEFGLQLFIRHHAQGLSLTPAGRRFLDAAAALLRQAEALHDVADGVATKITGPLRIGAFRTFAPLLIPDLCKSFLAAHPAVDFGVTEGDEAVLLARLRQAELDLALIYRLNLGEDIAFEPLAELPTYVLLAADHPWAACSSLTLAELAPEPFILLDMPLTRDYFLRLFAEAGTAPNILARSESPETVRSYVASGFGYSLATARPRNRQALNGRPLGYVALAGHHPPMILGLATLRGLRRTRVTQAFEDHCRALIATGAVPGMEAA